MMERFAVKVTATNNGRRSVCYVMKGGEISTEIPYWVYGWMNKRYAKDYIKKRRRECAEREAWNVVYEIIELEVQYNKRGV